MSKFYHDGETEPRKPVETGLSRAASCLTLPVAALWSVSTAIVICLVPGQLRRRRLARLAARALLLQLGLRVTFHGLEKLPEDSCIVVANHASYLDGILLTAILPPRFTFVIKREMADFPLVGILLRRLGSLFVDRQGNAARASADTRAILKGAAHGSAIGLFPEGTFKRSAGLLPFRSGAFVTAVKTGLPVCPITISGSRRALPAQSYCVLPGVRLAVTLHPPLTPQSRSREERLRLQAQARRAILSQLAEPDLAPATKEEEVG